MYRFAVSRFFLLESYIAGMHVLLEATFLIDIERHMMEHEFEAFKAMHALPSCVLPAYATYCVGCCYYVLLLFSRRSKT